MTDHVQEQEIEVEALKAILMDEFEVQSGLIFSHTENYPDEIPLLNLKSIKGIQASDLKDLKEKLEHETSEHLGKVMIYTLVTSANEWFAERFAPDTGNDDNQAEVVDKDEITVPHGEPVTVETFLAWREKSEAELALERAKLLPESAIVTTKERKLTGRQWFESGGASAKRVALIIEGSNDEDEDTDFDDSEDTEVDEEDIVEHYLAEKLDSSNYSSAKTT